MLNSINLNLNIHPLREGVDISSYGTEYIGLSKDHINPNLVSFLDTLDLLVVYIELFYTPSFSFTNIHADFGKGAIPNDYIRLNYVFGGKNSLMYWWKPRPNVSNPVNASKINSLYIGYKINEVDLIDEQQIQFPSIVQVGIPHNIRTFEEPRHCLSLVLRKKHDKTRLTMAESIEIFKDYL